MPFRDGSMDAVVGNLAILHFGQPERAAAEFARVLAPGGALALSTWDKPERARLVGAMYDAVSEVGATPPPHLPPGPPFFRFADEAEFARLLRDAGLTKVEVTTVEFTAG
jgi:SAM-dependent methyltransferase